MTPGGQGSAEPPRLVRPTAITLSGLILVFFAATLWAGSQVRKMPNGSPLLLLFIVCCAAVGLLLALRRPRNPIGWLLLGIALFFCFTGWAGAYSVLDYRQHKTYPLGALAVFLQPSWAPAIALAGVAVLVFPDGRPATRATRRALSAVVAGGALWQLGAFAIAVNAIVTHHIQVDAGGNLLAVDNPTGGWAWWGAVQAIFFLTLGLSLVLWLVVQLRHFRRETGDRRIQLKWLYGGVVIFIASAIVTGVPGQSTTTSAQLVEGVGYAGTCALPVSMGIAIMKFRLYDIDRIVSRALSYTLLTGLLAGTYVGLVAFGTRVLPFSSPVAVAASTLAAAALFNPLRARIQRGVDRRFNRARYDTEASIAAFAERLQATVDLDDTRQDLLRVIHTTLEPRHASIWLIRPRHNV